MIARVNRLSLPHLNSGGMARQGTDVKTSSPANENPGATCWRYLGLNIVQLDMVLDLVSSKARDVYR